MRNLSNKDWLFILSRFLLGVTFIVSATLKLLSIDAFELYVYGFEWFNFGLSCFLSRMVLLVEYFVGATFLFTVKNKWVDRLCGAALAVFTLFLIYLIIIGDEGNCHCFGDVFEFSPLESLLKNILLIFLYLGALKSTDLNFALKKYVIKVALVLALILSFIVRLPYPFGALKETPLNSEKLEIFLEQDSLSKEISHGDDLLFFLSTKCKYCKLAAKRMDVLLKMHPYPNENIHLYFWGDHEGVENFFKENEVSPLPYSLIHPVTLLDISGGKMPLIVLLKDGKVVGKMNNTTFDEEELVKFINNKQ